MTQTENAAGHIHQLSVSADRLVESTESVLNLTRLAAGQLQSALAVLATIDQAIGILVSRSGGTAEEATATLRAISRSRNAELVSVAQQIVEGAARRAEANRSHA